MANSTEPRPASTHLDILALEELKKGHLKPRIPERGEGVFYDPRLDLKDPEGTILTSQLLDAFLTARSMRRVRGRDVWELRIRKTAANLLRAHYYRQPSSVLYFRGAAVSLYDDQPKWMRHGALKTVVDALAKAGLVSSITGKKMPWYSETASYASSVWASNDLIGLAERLGVSRNSIVSHVADHDLVQLFSAKEKLVFDPITLELSRAKKGQRIRFDKTKETEEWVHFLKSINSFYRSQRIEFGLGAGSSEIRVSDGQGVLNEECSQRRTPEVFLTDLYRVFNYGQADGPSFHSGGRFFGAWWMSLPEQTRKEITINKQSVVELDYANCHPRMLYHQRGLNYVGDLYRIPEVEEHERESGLRLGAFRPYIKWLMQVLLNCCGRPDLVEVPADIVCPKGLSRGQIVDYVRRSHAPISEAFRTGVGLELMRIESDIAYEIMNTAMKEGWPVLSVHDSFLAAAGRAEALLGIMKECYKKRLGFQPVIKGMETTENHNST